MLRQLALAAAVVAALSATAVAQNSDLIVTGPAEILELEPSFELTVAGTDIYDLPLDVYVFADSVDITSQLSISIPSESRVDTNNDGVLETYDARYAVSLGTFDLSPGQQLMAEIRAPAPGGTLVRQVAARVDSHVSIDVDSAIASGDDAIHLAVHTRRIAVSSQSLSVELDGVDVTSQVTITGPELVFEDTDSGTPPFVRCRMQRYWVDISSLGQINGRLRFTIEAAASAGGSSSSSTSAPVSGAGEEPSDCEKAALNAFVNSIGASKDSSGNVSIAANGPGVKAAADALQQAIEACEEGGLGNYPVAHTTPSGLKVKIVLETDGDAATVSGKADVVVAIGGDGAGSAGGGSASATNTQPGGAAVAVGGDGGSGVSTPGNGGTGTATSAPPAGTSVGVGGNGGSPLDKTHAGGSGGTGGGYQGKPSQDPVAGGKQPGSQGAPGSPAGTHGMGGWFYQGPGGGGGATQPPQYNP